MEIVDPYMATDLRHNFVRLRRIILLSIFFFISFGYLFVSNGDWENHIIAIKGSFEVYLLAILLNLFFFPLMTPWRDPLVKAAFGLGLIGCLYIVLSSMLALSAFDQPLYFGLLEDRRALVVLAPLAFTSVYYLIRPTPKELFSALLIAALSQMILATINQYAFSAQLLSRRLPDLDPRKLRIANGAATYSCIFVVACVNLRKDRLFGNLFAIFVAVYGLLFIIQSKALFLTTMITLVILILRKYPFTLLFFTTVASISALYIVITSATPFDNFPELIDSAVPGLGIGELLQSGDRVRAQTTAIIFNELGDNNYIGMGALSLLWRDGFSRIYNEHFFLSDVGLAGELYRVGIFYPIFASAIALYLIFVLAHTNGKEDRLAIFALSMMIFVSIPAAGLFQSPYYGMIQMIALCSRFHFKNSVDLDSPYKFDKDVPTQ